MSSARSFVEEAIRILDRLISDEGLNKNLKTQLIHIRSLLFRAEVDLIALHKLCVDILRSSLSLSKYLDVSVVKAERPLNVYSKEEARKRLLSLWKQNAVMTLEDIRAVIGPIAQEIVDDLLKEGFIRIAKAEWENGAINIYYKRVT
ncbi:MAG: hypothetical protein J7L11_07935 [Thermoprotei archaeon]|nr:hypothetical protein [Thermoprotei archaeon]